MRLGVAVALVVVAAALPAAQPAGATHDPGHAASGDWLMTFPHTAGRADTGKLHLMFLSGGNQAAWAAAAAMDQRNATNGKWGSWAVGAPPVQGVQIGGECGTGATQYYTGTFSRDTDSGPVVGCLSGGTSSLFYAVFYSTQYNVEGGFSGTLGAVMAAGIFPSQPMDEFNTQFLGHFAGDGAAPEEETLSCGGTGLLLATSSLIRARRAVDASPTLAVCKINRVLFYQGTNQVYDATSQRSFVGQTVYFVGKAASKVVPALVVVVFPKDVDVGNIFIPDQAANVGVTCKAPAAVPDGRKVLVCMLNQSKGKVVVGVKNLPQSLAGSQLELQIRVGKPLTKGQNTPEWLASSKGEVAVDTQVVPLPPPTPTPTPKPATPANPIIGLWQTFKPIGGTSRENLPVAYEGESVRLALVNPQAGGATDLFATTTASTNGFQLFLNKPKSDTNVFDGELIPPGVNAITPGARKAVQLELIPAGAFAKDMKQYCAGYAIQAKAPILCGPSPFGQQVIVLARVGN